MNSNKRKLVFMILLIGVCFIAYRYMIKPASENFAEQKQQLQIQMNKLSQFEKAAVVIKDWDSEIEQLEEAQSGYIEQPLKMKLEGDFNSYYSFLLDIEKLDRITKIRKLKLNKKSKAQGYTEAECVVSIFFQS